MLGLYWILAPALANPESSHFMEIWPSPALAKFLVLICRMTMQLPYVHLVMDKTSIAVLSSGVFVSFISITWTKKNTIFIVVPQISSKKANSDATNEALNCTASSDTLTGLLTSLVSSAYCSVTRKQVLPKSGSRFELLNLARYVQLRLDFK